MPPQKQRVGRAPGPRPQQPYQAYQQQPYQPQQPYPGSFAAPVRPLPGAPPRVELQKNLARSIAAGHPWLYRDALRVPPGLQTGDTVDLFDHPGPSGRFLARGLYDAESPIALRIFTLDPSEGLDAALIRRRLDRALSVRRQLPELGGDEAEGRTTAFRLCHGEGDFLPGIVVDVYGHVAVVSCDGAAARTLLPGVTEALLSLGRDGLGVTAVYARNQRRSGGGGELLAGSLTDPGAPAAVTSPALTPGELVVFEHGMRFVVDVVSGQKTGLFLDQRENRRLLRRYARGRSVWNGFAYTGGFSIAAALGGASRVVTVDQARPAIEAARRNFAENGVDPSAHEFYADDCFDHLTRAARRGVHYDLVLVDPPSFAKASRDLPTALGAYRELHRLAADVVAPGGLLAAASCSSHVPEREFIGTIEAAAQAARRRAQILEIHGQPADHPTLPAFPEGRYLKFVLLRLD